MLSMLSNAHGMEDPTQLAHHILMRLQCTHICIFTSKRSLKWASVHGQFTWIYHDWKYKDRKKGWHGTPKIDVIISIIRQFWWRDTTPTGRNPMYTCSTWVIASRRPRRPRKLEEKALLASKVCAAAVAGRTNTHGVLFFRLTFNYSMSVWELAEVMGTQCRSRRRRSGWRGRPCCRRLEKDSSNKKKS